MELYKADNFLVYADGVTCPDHGTPSEYVLKIGDILIPMCDTCLRELKDMITREGI